MDTAVITEKVLIRRVDERHGFGYAVTVIRTAGPHRGREHCAALLCGGPIGRALATAAGRLVAENYGIDDIEIDADLVEEMATKDVQP